MYCPSCERQMPDDSSYCARCGMFLNKASKRLMQISINISWILRRSMGGFAAGAISWIFAMAVVRTVGINSGPGLHSFLLCAISGTFLGTVGGIIEDSGYKALVGAVIGCIGGSLGALLGGIIISMLGFEPLGSVSFIPAWIVMGMAIGSVSGIIEKSTKKIIVGMLFGVCGGVLGGFIGIELYGSLVTDFMKQDATWVTGRGIEAFAGGVFGASFWMILGIIEKLYIFKRRIELKVDKKICDSCHTGNQITAWYCVNCGAALQVAAPREKIKVTSFRSLERTINAFRFLSWLFGATGIIMTLIIFFVVLFTNPIFAFLGGLSIALLSYLLVIFFHFTADLLSSLVKITDSFTTK